MIPSTKFGAFLRTLLRHRRPTRRQVLSLSFLPPYSPELNPVKRVWKLARTLCTHNQYFPLLADLVTAVSVQLELWRKPELCNSYKLLLQSCMLICEEKTELPRSSPLNVTETGS